LDNQTKDLWTNKEQQNTNNKKSYTVDHSGKKMVVMRDVRSRSFTVVFRLEM